MRRSMPTSANGRWGETVAQQFLVARGCEIIARNFRTRYGEIDLIVRDERTIVFVEVKTRVRDSGAGEASVDWRKQQRIVRAARAYVQHAPDAVYRFDVLVVLYVPRTPTVRIRHYRDAFDTTLVF